MPVYDWDVSWFLLVNHDWQNPILDWVFPPIAEIGYLGWLGVLLLLPLWDRKKGMLASLVSFTAWACSSYVGETLLKPLLMHPHPSAVPDLASQVHLLVPAPAPSSFSFPSNAALLSFAVVGVGWYFYPGLLRVAAFAVAALIGFSQVYVGAHFPSDVLGGMILGLLIGLGGTALMGRFWRRSNADSS